MKNSEKKLILAALIEQMVNGGYDITDCITRPLSYYDFAALKLRTIELKLEQEVELEEDEQALLEASKKVEEVVESEYKGIMSKELSIELKLIDIPETDVCYEVFEKRREKAEDQDLVSCPCCGKGIKNEKYFINSIYGGSVYLASDQNEYDDAWTMAVGSECRKLFPKGYVFEA
jgi:hypothetical protein